MSNLVILRRNQNFFSIFFICLLDGVSLAPRCRNGEIRTNDFCLVRLVSLHIVLPLGLNFLSRAIYFNLRRLDT